MLSSGVTGVTMLHDHWPLPSVAAGIGRAQDPEVVGDPEGREDVQLRPAEEAEWEVGDGQIGEDQKRSERQRRHRERDRLPSSHRRGGRHRRRLGGARRKRRSQRDDGRGRDRPRARKRRVPWETAVREDLAQRGAGEIDAVDPDQVAGRDVHAHPEQRVDAARHHRSAWLDDDPARHRTDVASSSRAPPDEVSRPGRWIPGGSEGSARR